MTKSIFYPKLQLNNMILFFIFLLLVSPAKAENYFIEKVIRVTDGDTFVIDTSEKSSILRELGLSVRILGIDTPEKKGKCKKEKDLALKATELTKKLIENKIIKITDIKWDKYGGRINAKVFVNDLNVGDELIKKNLAVLYFGEKKNKNWCK